MSGGSKCNRIWLFISSMQTRTWGFLETKKPLLILFGISFSLSFLQLLLWQRFPLAHFLKLCGHLTNLNLLKRKGHPKKFGHTALGLGWYGLRKYVMIFLGSISVHNIYLDIFKSAQKHFINARPGRQNQTLWFFWTTFPLFLLFEAYGRLLVLIIYYK